ncbi:GINS subunit, domain A,DNA replication complex GINS protein SLD5, C-terminal,GINS complex subunit Sld5 [Cinara cedri]|uniref:DNA replication complex GINS protein SLD5 n=1 Tax=Cinara cedri TaxID=506608 RepID=A0A5E4N103_9HEMI|nr:GINS subunit, domain A,DNA replication complex GINS protein SLD5, C-terminal,GINS complex subunit Sld5 [Cinara cedri]
MDIDILDLIDDEDDDNQEEMTAQKVLQIVERAWLNEKFSPEILPHQTDYVDCLLEQIKGMEDNLAKLSKTDPKVDLHKLEMERIKFVITSYLRTRLKKIEYFCVSVLEEESNRLEADAYLSPAELKFAKEFAQNADNHFDTILRHMPQLYNKLDMNKKVIKPNLNSFVFLKCYKHIDSVIIQNTLESQEEEIVLEDGSQHLMPYSSVAEFVKKGAVQLI